MLGLWVIASLVGCKGVDPAPEDIDGLLHWFWQNAATASDADLAESFATLHTAQGASLEETLDGEATDLVQAEVDLVNGSSADPELASGIFMLNPFACDADHLEKVLVHLAQDDLYDGVYDNYDRSYLSDRPPFDAGEVGTLDWEVDIEASILGGSYTEHIEGGIRRVETDVGAAFVTRTWMTGPAVFEEGSNKTWEQDYQLEVYYERSPGEIVHLYGMWRQMDVGLSSDNPMFQRTVLNNLADWDDNTETLCAENRP